MLVTAGGTREPIDAVRYVGNRSCGRMGFALAEEAAALRRRRDGRRRQRRARRAAPRRRATSTSRPPPSSPPPATREFDACDVLLMAAAVADFRPAEPRATASSRRTDRRGARARARAYRRTCSRRWPRARRPGQMLVGFAAEHGDGRARVRPRQARAQGARRGRRQRRRARRASASTPPTTRSRSSPPTASGTSRAASKAEVARAILRRGRPAFASDTKAALTERDEHGPSVARRRRSRRRRAGAAHRREHPPRRRGARRGARATSSSALARRGPHPDRGLPGRRQDDARPRARALARPRSSRACSAPPTCCPPTSSAPTSSTSARRASSSGPGPIFANVVLVDEINRASPKTQSGLLECMQERRVTVDVHIARARAPVPRLRDAEPGRVRGHLPAARGAGRPLHGPRSRSATRRRRPRSACSPATRRGDRVERARAGRRPPPRCSRRRTPRTRVHASDALRDYVVALLQPHARGRRASSSAPARAPG